MKNIPNPFKALLIFLCFEFSLCGITLNIIESSFKTYRIKVCIGSEEKCDDLNLSFSLRDVSVYKNSKYKYEESKTCRKVYKYEDFYLLLDNLRLPDFEGVIENTYVNFHYDSVINKCGIIGLGKNKKDAYVPIIEKIYSLLGGPRTFYIDTYKMVLGIGEYPEEYLKGNIKYCTMDNTKIGYGCYFDSLYYKKTKSAQSENDQEEYVHLKIEETVLFDPAMNGITVPKETIENIIANYLKPLIDKRICTPRENTEFLYVRCKDSYDYEGDESISDLTFIFEGFSLKLTKRELFSFYDDDVYFLIVFNKEQENITFGYPFLKKFAVVVDEESNRIGFYKYEAARKSSSH